jgi:hypothetical protein
LQRSSGCADPIPGGTRFATEVNPPRSAASGWVEGQGEPPGREKGAGPCLAVPWDLAHCPARGAAPFFAA